MSLKTMESEAMRLLKESPQTARTLADELRVAREVASGLLQRLRIAGLAACAGHVWVVTPAAARRAS